MYVLSEHLFVCFIELKQIVLFFKYGHWTFGTTLSTFKWKRVIF